MRSGFDVRTVPFTGVTSKLGLLLPLVIVPAALSVARELSGSGSANATFFTTSLFRVGGPIFIYLSFTTSFNASALFSFCLSRFRSSRRLDKNDPITGLSRNFDSTLPLLRRLVLVFE